MVATKLIRFYLAPAAVGVLLVCFGGSQLPHRKPITQPTSARIPVAEVLKQVDGINRMLAPTETKLRSTVQPFTVGDGRFRFVPTYAVYTNYADGEVCSYTLWNACTGRLLTLSHHPRQDAGAPSFPLEPQEVQEMSWRWMQRTHVAEIAPHWSLVGRPHAFGAQWIADWRGGDYRVHVNIDRTSHALTYLFIQHGDTPPHSA